MLYYMVAGESRVDLLLSDIPVGYKPKNQIVYLTYEEAWEVQKPFAHYAVYGIEIDPKFIKRRGSRYIANLAGGFDIISLPVHDISDEE